jgi:DNA-binding MarR family transcriptional regulator
MAGGSGEPPRFGIAFLLAQLGAHASERFATALAEQDVTPPLAGIMRLLRVEPGLTQQQVADRLGTPPSRIVGYLDDLEGRGWITRTRGTTDRRVNTVALTDAGAAAFGKVALVSRDHEQRITGGLDDAEYAALRELLGKLAAANGLAPGIHPGYRGPGSATAG